jgi:soluble lytic murein transglycosylase-like protein
MKILFFGLSLLLSTSIQADIFKYVSPDGQIHLTNRPTPGLDYRLVVHMRPRTYQSDLKHLSTNKTKYNDLIARAAARHQMEPRLLHAVIQTESAYNPSAVSPAGAVGIMQLMPDTARRYGVTDRLDVEQNIDAGARYLKDLLAMFNSDLRLAVAGYNAGEGAVIKYNHNIPPYPETINYVQQVLRLYAKG